VQANSTRQFGDSWVVSEYAEDNPQCTAGCNDPDEVEECSGDDMIRARLACDRIYEEQGKFKVIHTTANLFC